MKTKVRMPVIWRLLLSQYLKVLVLSIVAIICVLMTTRLDELAQFAVLGASTPHIWLFILYQIPYILPIALLLSALLSGLLLMQRLSGHNELIALRACGYGLGNIIAPIVLAAALLGIANFYIASELATYSHMMRRAITGEIKTMNPLVLLQNQQIANLKGIYVSAKGALSNGEQATDVIVAAVNPKHGNLDLILSQQLHSTDAALEAEGVTLLTSLTSNLKDEFPSTYIENAEQMFVPTKDLSSLIGGGNWQPKDDYLSLGLLLDRLSQQRLQPNYEPSRIQKIYSEILRRIALALAVVTFTFMGLAYGVYLSPRHQTRHIGSVIAWTALALTCFFLAKGQHARTWIAALLYLGPQLLILLASMLHLRRINQGVIS